MHSNGPHSGTDRLFDVYATDIAGCDEYAIFFSYTRFFCHHDSSSTASSS